MKLAIISHTQHYKLPDNTIVGWGPTIKEINHLSKSFSEIYHIAPLHKEKAPKSAIAYNSTKSKFISLKPSGGRNFEKLSIVFNLPYNIYKIHNSLKKVDIIQFRAPTGIGIYVLPFLKFFNRKKYWVKYAGNWKDLNMPLGNKLQKKWLQNYLPLESKVTINGKWGGEKENIISFENPCLDKDEREEGKIIINKKDFSNKLNYCFVGALTKHKGVDKIIEAFTRIKSDKVGEIHFIGSGEKEEEFINKSKNIKNKVVFHGFIAKDKIKEIYKKCHFIILPSKSEGFPKVIGEAMNFGCIPIVSNVSCINQYIEDSKNGLLIDPLTINNLVEKIDNSLKFKLEVFKNIINENYLIASKFTYSYYIDRIKKEILSE